MRGHPVDLKIGQAIMRECGVQNTVAAILLTRQRVPMKTVGLTSE